MSDKTLAPTTGIIMTAMQSGMTHIDAASEFVDNSFGPAAGDADKIVIIDAADGTMFWDQGRGVTDVNLLFRLGDGSSRASANDIGRFGVGSKFGALTFGADVDVFTVHKGVYHRFRVNWKDVMTRGVWPHAYTGAGDTRVPAGVSELIGGGGTIVLVRDLHKGRARPQDTTYIRRLGLRFMPALEAGKDIEIRRAKSVKQALEGQFTTVISIRDAFKEHMDRVLRNVGHAVLEVNGKTAKAVFAELPEGDKTLSGVHFAFGGRVIETITRLDDVSLPSKFFARIDLGPEFKADLNYNKTVLLDGIDALSHALIVAAEELISKLQHDDAQRGIERLSAAITNMLDPGFGSRLFRSKAGAFKRADDGSSVTVRNVSPDPDKQRGGSSSRPSDLADDEAKRQDGDTHEIRGAFAFDIRPDYYGKEADVTRCDLFEDGKKVVCRVFLNRSVPVIEEALKGNPANKPAVTLICVQALACHIVNDEQWIARLFGPDKADAVLQQPIISRLATAYDELMKMVISPGGKSDEQEQRDAA